MLASLARVSLACALFASPDLLLLDEPTNHLDLEAVMWLERYLTKTYKGTLLLVSHDRHFLNAVVTDVCHFHRQALSTYKGDINNFVAVREEQMLSQRRMRENQEEKRKQLQKYVPEHRAAAHTSGRAEHTSGRTHERRSTRAAEHTSGRAHERPSTRATSPAAGGVRGVSPRQPEILPASATEEQPGVSNSS
jgi:ATPase subunit of ABC transporter with duplicated ATPase domains